LFLIVRAVNTSRKEKIMIIVMGEIRIAEGALEPVKGAIATMETESLKESGCEAYSFSIRVSDPTVVHISERWQSMDDLAAHFAEPHMAEFQAALSQVEILGMDVKAFDVSGEVPLPGS
jgi:quinol monooxygenase YgiN